MLQFETVATAVFCFSCAVLTVTVCAVQVYTQGDQNNTVINMQLLAEGILAVQCMR